MQFTLHARIYLHAEVTHATFLHAHTWTNMHTVLYACVCTHTHTHAYIHYRGKRKACAPPCPKPVLNRSPKVLRRPICLGSDQNLRGTDIPAQ